MSILGELKRRKMFQVAAVYLVVAWMIMQIVDVINQPLNLADWFDAAIIVFLAIAFPMTLVLSWAFKLTPTGVFRETAGDELSQSSVRTIAVIGCFITLRTN